MTVPLPKNTCHSITEKRKSNAKPPHRHERIVDAAGFILLWK